MKRFRIYFFMAAILLSSSCIFMLEKRGSRFKDIDEDDIAADFSEGRRTLPVIFVDTEDDKGINNKEYWKEADIKIYTPEGHSSKMEVDIRGRGNSTWSFPKKPFNIRFDEATSILGMPDATKLCALANWRDRTRIRNAVSFEIARQTSMPWTAQGRFVDLVVDEDWKGNYYITEKLSPSKVGVGKNGYMIFIDAHYDKTYRFRTKIKDLPVNIITESDIALNAKAFSNIRSSVDAVEDALYNNKSTWSNLIDIESFCDWFIVHEVTGNDEATRTYGVYMYSTGDGVLKAGPCWDFDYHTFRPGATGLTNAKSIWFDALLSKPEFKAKLKERWAAIRPLIVDYIPAFIKSTAAEIEESISLDYQLWPIKHVITNGDESLSFADAVARLQQALTEKIALLDSYCSTL